MDMDMDMDMDMYMYSIGSPYGRLNKRRLKLKAFMCIYSRVMYLNKSGIRVNNEI
jgi:hypothetical protein